METPVLEYIKKNYENLEKDILKYNESFNDSVDDINAAITTVGRA